VTEYVPPGGVNMLHQVPGAMSTKSSIRITGIHLRLPGFKSLLCDVKKLAQ
jgi:hypothetical protein